MSGEVIKDFIVSIGFKADNPAAIENFSKKVAAGAATIAAGFAAAAAGVFAFTKAAADELDYIGDLSARVNSTVESLKELGYVAQLSGSSIEASNASIEALAKNAGDAALGLGRAGKVFEAIGIDVNDFDTAAELMFGVGDAIKDLGRGEQLSIMGRLGIDKTMIDTITGDVTGLREEFKKTYSAFGLNINQAAKDAGKFQDALDRLRFAADAAGKSLSMRFIKTFTEAMDKLKRFIIDAGPKIVSALEPILRVVLSISSVFVMFAYRAGQAIGKIIEGVLKLNRVLGGIPGYIIAVVGAWKLLNSAFLASPLGRLIALAGIVALLIDDFLVFKDKGTSLIDWGSGFGDIMKGVTAALGTFLAYVIISKAAVIAFTAVSNAWAAAMVIIKGVLAAARVAVLVFNLALWANPIGLMIAAIVGGIALLIGAAYLLIENWETVEDWFKSFFDWLASGFDKVAEWGSKIGSFFGFGDTPALAPDAGSTSNRSSSVNQNTQIVVQGSADPKETAYTVAGIQKSINADLARNTAGAVR